MVNFCEGDENAPEGKRLRWLSGGSQRLFEFEALPEALGFSRHLNPNGYRRNKQF